MNDKSLLEAWMLQCGLVCGLNKAGFDLDIPRCVLGAAGWAED